MRRGRALGGKEANAGFLAVSCTRSGGIREQGAAAPGQSEEREVCLHGLQTTPLLPAENVSTKSTNLNKRVRRAL